MRFIPITKEQKEEMLKEIGVSSFEEIIKCIPKEARVKKEIDLPEALSEQEIYEFIKKIHDKNYDFSKTKCLAGCGAYSHYIPEVVSTITSYPEFYTAYTPYQPELSQGTLQTMFEVQTHLANLTGMDAVVPSLYNGASATAEAVLMAMRLSGKNKIILYELLHPQYAETINTYIEPHGTEVLTLHYRNFLLDLNDLEKMIDDSVACVVIQSPNFFGGIENISQVSKITHDKKVILIQVVTESLSLAILKSPSEMGADIVAGEAQSFGIPLNFGGPHNGFIGTKNEFIRQLPGRIVGETTDTSGKRAFVMTLRAREQDIRREKATSNVCSNHNLNLFAINAFISTYGRNGLYELAERNIKASHYLKKRLLETEKFENIEYPFFNEFALRVKKENIDEIRQKLLENNYIPPCKASSFFPLLRDILIFAVTEIFSRKELDEIASIVGG